LIIKLEKKGVLSQKQLAKYPTKNKDFHKKSFKINEKPAVSVKAKMKH